jgi:EpsI family protein
MMSFRNRCLAMTGLLLVAAAGLHSLSHGEPRILVRPLSAFPYDLDQRSAIDIPLSNDVLQVLRVDDYLNRVYREQAGKPIALYIAYYKSQRTGETIHSPKNCLPGAGWQPVEAGYTRVALPDGGAAKVNRYVIEKGLDRQLVLYWYQSHGRIIASEYAAKVYMVEDALRLNRTDSALVRVVTDMAPDSKQAEQELKAFAGQVIAQTQDLSPR